MSNINRFVEAYNECGSFNLNTVGPKFSWVRHVGVLTSLWRKLDWVLWNMDAQMLFLEGKAFILSRSH